MPKLKSIMPPARLRAPAYNRDINVKLRSSRAFGTSTTQRIERLKEIAAAAKADPTFKARYVPKPGRLAKLVSPTLFRSARVKQVLRPCKAEVEVLLKASSGKHREYARLTNGQIVKAHRISDERSLDNVVIQTPGSPVTLRPADLKQIATKPLPTCA